jgi:quercetin dioxygenase-like cupin family protein
MALPHAQPLDVISVRPLGDALPQSVSTSLIKTERLQLLHMVLPQHADMPEHHVNDSCVVHCLEGQIDVVMPSGNRRLMAGELVVLPAGQPHALRARAASAVLVTLLRVDDTLGGGPSAPPEPPTGASGQPARRQGQQTRG